MLVTVSLAQSKKTKSFNYFWLLSLLGLLVLSFLISLGVAIGLNDWSILYSYLINLPFVLLVGLVHHKSYHWLFNLAKQQKNKIYFFSILIFSLKGLILCCGLIIGLIINQFNQTFNLVALIVNLVIYPLASLITTIIFNLYLNKNKNI